MANRLRWFLSGSALLCALQSSVFAKAELVSKVQWKNQTSLDGYTITSELYYDKETKKADLWFDYTEITTEVTREKIAYKSTSLAEKLKDADYKLVPMAFTEVEGVTSVIFDPYESKTGNYDGNRGAAIVFHFPVKDIESKEKRELLIKTFPNSVIKDATGNPTHFKALLCRVTYQNVAPIAAFDGDLTGKLN